MMAEPYPRRVLIIGPVPPPIGGDTVSTSNLLKSRYWNSAGFMVDHIDTSARGEVKLVEVKRSWKDMLRALRILSKLLVKLPRADILLLWANSSFICSLGIPVMNLARISGKPYMVKIFGAMLPERIDALGPRRRKTVVSLLGRARYLLPQTKLLADQLAARYSLAPERIVQFPNFLPDSYFAAMTESARFSGRCVFIGQIKSEKGVFDIIDSIRDRNDISCDFYGQPVERDTDRFMLELQRSPNCFYRGTLTRDEVMKILGGYDILLLPTTHPGEGYPAVILEAFAAGLPVISTRWMAIPELVEDGVRGLLVPPSSPGHISAAIDLLSNDEQLYSSIAKNAHSYVGRFSEKAVVGDILIGLVGESVG
jgi:glycosyltransferase involved in cell wall biosynthesis